MKAPLGELFAELAAVQVANVKAEVKPKPPVPQEKTPEPKQEVAPKPVKPQAKKKLPGLGVSIRGKSKTEEEKSPAADDQVNEPVGNRPLNIEEVEAKWRTFARAQENFAEQTLLSAIPHVEGDSTIVVALQNNFQKQTIEDAQQTLVPYLRKQLSNSAIMLKLTVSEALESTRAFTPHEKLKEMIKDHPDLNLLIERFNLEIE